MMNTPSAVATSMPQNTPVPITFCAPAPAPLACISGTTPEDEGEGRHQDRPEAQAGRLERGLLERHAAIVLRLGELDDQDRVLGRQADQHDQADLHVDVVVVAHQPDAEEGAQRDQRRPEQHRPGQPPALVHRGQQQEHADDGHDEGRPGGRRDLLLVGHRRVGEAHLLGHRLREDLLQRRQRLPGGVAAARATPWISTERSRLKRVVSSVPAMSLMVTSVDSGTISLVVFERT